MDREGNIPLPYTFYDWIFYYLWMRVEPILNGRFVMLAMASMVFVVPLFGSAYRTDKWQALFYLY